MDDRLARPKPDTWEKKGMEEGENQKLTKERLPFPEELSPPCSGSRAKHDQGVGNSKRKLKGKKWK